MTLTVRIYSATRTDANNSNIALTQLGTASDTLAAGAKNKHYYNCDFASVISGTVDAGKLLFIGFEFTCEDDATEMTGHIKATYTLSATKA